MVHCWDIKEAITPKEAKKKPKLKMNHYTECDHIDHWTGIRQKIKCRINRTGSIASNEER